MSQERTEMIGTRNLSITQKLAHYALTEAELLFENEFVKKIAEQSFTDCIECMLIGSKEITAKHAIDYAKETLRRPVCGIVGDSRLRFSPCDAAMINSIEAHVFDYDDMSEAIGGHPGVTIVPVIRP